MGRGVVLAGLRVLALFGGLCCALICCPTVVAAQPLPFTGETLTVPDGPFTDLEPGIAAAGNGDFIIGATSPGRGSDVWVSHDGGLSYRWASAPFSVPPGPENGQDSDVAAAPVANGAGPPNLYATTLYSANSALAVSDDGGKSFRVNLLGGIPSQDRPWLAADGPCTVYLAYQNGDSGPPSREMVSRFDACQGPQQTGQGSVLDPAQGPTDPYPLGAFLGGKLMVDTLPTSPYRHNVYIPMGGCETDLPSPTFIPSTNPFDCQFARATLSIAVSSDGGQSFTVHRVTDSTTHQLQIWPDQLAVDAAGKVYLAWGDNHHVYLDTSGDGGQTWTPPRAINAPPALSAVLPTVAAGAPGHVDIAWYGAQRDGASNDQSLMGAPGAQGGAQWRVYFAKSVDGGGSFEQAAVSPGVHTGTVCTSANVCVPAAGRGLFEDFGIAISPTTQRASIAYTDDQLSKPDATALDHRVTGFATELEQRVAPCTLRFARARVLVFRHRRAVRLVIHYRTQKPARVAVAFSLRRPARAVRLGLSRARFQRQGTYRTTVHPPLRLYRAARRTRSGFIASFRVPRNPGFCRRAFARKLTKRRRVHGQTVWFQPSGQP